MPKIPTYRSDLPECLNPLNPRHYLFLLYWVFFRPTAMKCYLYHADSDLYSSSRKKDIFHIWKVPAYRNLCLMIPGIIILLLTFWVGPFFFLCNFIFDIPTNGIEDKLIDNTMIIIVIFLGSLVFLAIISFNYVVKNMTISRTTQSMIRGTVGVVLVLLGAFFLFSEFGLLGWFSNSFFWPLLIIGIGIYVLVRRSR